MNVTQYLSSLNTPEQQSAIEFWQQQVGNSPIPLIALNMISAPASQTFVERSFSVCAMQYNTIKYNAIQCNTIRSMICKALLYNFFRSANNL